MPASTSWADRLKLAEQEETKFAPLELGVKNFEVAKTEVKTAQSGSRYLSIQCKVADGPQKNARVFHSLFPESPKGLPIRNFMAFYNAVGLSEEWLRENNPDLDAIASAFQDRKFSAEVYVEDDAREDSYTNAPRRSIRNVKPQGIAEPSGTDSPSQFPSAPQKDEGQPQADASDPWKTSNSVAPPF